MSLFRSLGQKFAGGPSSVFARTCARDGIAIRFVRPLNEPSVDALLALTDEATPSDTWTAAYLAQLVNEGCCTLSKEAIIVPWDTVYRLIASDEHASLVRRCLDLPDEVPLRPILDSDGTLADVSFDVFVAGWVRGETEIKPERIDGAVAQIAGQEVLLPEFSWRLHDAIDRFRARGAEQRSQHHNELEWGRIRALADSADAFYRTPYLETTHVLTPERLRMPLRKDETHFGRVITVEPTFDGAPKGWLKQFDGFTSIQSHYDFASSDGGHTRVVISEPVRRVLEVIKRDMPGRRVAGARAERFVRNPFAFLGESAHEVLDEETFEADKAAAGPLAAVFSVAPRLSEGRLGSVDLVVTEHFHAGASRTTVVPFDGPDHLSEFIDTLTTSLREERVQFPWREYDLTIDGTSADQLEISRQILSLWRNQPADRIALKDIYELEGYSARIEGIGVAKPIYVPLIQRPSSEQEGQQGWSPEDLTLMIKATLAGHGEVILPLNKEWIHEFEEQVSKAESSGGKEVVNQLLPTPVDTVQARVLVNSLKSMLGAQERFRPGDARPKAERKKRETLLVKLNFFGIDYLEQRHKNLALPDGAQAELPRSIRPSIALKKHQLDGVAWFQHLVSRAPLDCRGALLADDMGLGKTLQLLSLLGWFYENNPNASPSIIFAPKSLVENWRAEVSKFFTESYPKVLLLHSDELRRRKQPLNLIDQQLQARGVIELLKPNWIGDARIIITTYEVLTNYEFSLARQPFAFIICDEAQRIKTPGTQATLAAKALRGEFRIACTGTPVENSLADLWCLFDFVQPGLLGGLEDFGRSYRRPIECKTEEQRETLDHLQQAIVPQTLRRTKLDIASELPKKYFGHKIAGATEVGFKEVLGETERLDIRMSEHQNVLYLGGLKKLQDAVGDIDGRRRARLSFGALHLMKAVCAEPYCLPGMKFLPDNDGRVKHLINSPKLAWLLGQLRSVRDRQEKAIVFTELREVQAALYYFLREEFAIKASIVNGDSQNRQAYIDRFTNSQGFNVIILSTLAAGAGLNVTAANHVFHFTRAWNSAKENQATDRAYRIGQAKDVYVYCPVITSDEYVTFDVRLDELLRRKATLAAAAIGSAMTSMLNGTSNDVSITELILNARSGISVERRVLTIDDVDRLNGEHFEILCKTLWARAGYENTLITSKRGGDGGIDVVAIKGNAEGDLLQCKSSVNREVGWDAIKEVTTGAARYQLQFRNTAFRKVAVTNQRFTSNARAHAEANNVVLIEREQLKVMLARHAVHNVELDEEFINSFGLREAA